MRSCGGLLSAECFVDRHKFLRCKIGKKLIRRVLCRRKERARFRIFLMFLFALKLNALDDAADKTKSEHGKKDVVTHNL